MGISQNLNKQVDKGEIFTAKRLMKMTFQALALRQTIHSFYQRQPPRNGTKCFDVFAKVAKISKNIPFENVKDYFYLVANLLAAVLEKKYVAVWQRSTKTRRTV